MQLYELHLKTKKIMKLNWSKMNTKLKNKDLPKEYTKEMEEFNLEVLPHKS